VLRHVLLVVLCDGEPRHGYAILKAFRRRTGFDMSPGTVYRELQGLRRRGYIEPTGDACESDPRRITYRITTRGRESARGWLAQPPPLPRRSIADEIDYRLSVLDAMEPERALAFLADLLARLRLSTELGYQERRLDECEDDGVAAFLRDRHLRRVEADVAFLEALRMRLVESRPSPAVST
jgi:DNA-binding PadR family transcriptional regulator